MFIEFLTVKVVDPVQALIQGAAPPALTYPALQEKQCVAPA